MRKEHLLLPWPTHEPPLEELDPATLFCFLALKMQYWAGSNSIPFPMGLLSICTDGSGPASALEELRIWAADICDNTAWSGRHSAYGKGDSILPGEAGTASQKE